MARPESIKDIPLDERADVVASFYVDKISANPGLLKYYAGLLEVVQKAGGEVERSEWCLQNVTLHMPKDAKQLAHQLKQMQSRWDTDKELYESAVIRDTTGRDFRDWERSNVERFAEKEGLPNPFDVFAANDDELDKIRAELEANRQNVS
jgi:hypothetical protein